MTGDRPGARPDAADAGTTVYGRVYVAGVTRDAGAPITAELGYGVKIEDDPETNRQIFASVKSLADFVTAQRAA